MKVSYISVSLLFLAGFLVGNFASHIGFGFDAPRSRVVETAPDEQEAVRPKLAQSTRSCECYEGTGGTAERRPSQGSTKIAGQPRERSFPNQLPAHVVDPYFFGPDIDDPDVIWRREEAAREFIASLEGSGLPAEQIATLTAMAEDELAAIANPVPDGAVHEDSLLPPPSREEQMDTFAQSLREAGQPEESIEQMVDDMWAAEPVEPADNFEDMQSPHLRDPDATMQ